MALLRVIILSASLVCASTAAVIGLGKSSSYHGMFSSPH
jgi:hypothetical protein